MTLEERFWAKVRKGDGCWEWTGAKTTPDGYGIIARTGMPRTMVTSNRASWELHFGPIPDGLFVLHACDNRACVRPDHLMLGTHRANMVDASRKGRTGPQIRDWTVCKRGHPFEGNTYIHPSTGRRSCLKCISIRSSGRPPSPRPGRHFARPDESGYCGECGERLEFGSMGRGRVGWRHTRWAA